MFAAAREEVFESGGGEGGRGGGADDQAQLRAVRENTAYRLGDKDPDRAGIVRDGLNPRAAFEVFAGKVYFPQQQSFTLADSNEKRVESPVQRFSRLRGELDELVSDLDALAKDDGAAAAASQEATVWSAMQSEARQMVAKMVEIKSHSGFNSNSSSAASVVQRFEQLSSKILESSGALPGPPMSAGQASNYSDVVALERRVSALETMLGHASNMLDAEGAQRGSLLSGLGGSGTFPLVDAIVRLERRVAMTDPAVLDALRLKASQLKADLESTTPKSVGSGKTQQASEHSQALEAARRVDDLCEQVEKVRIVADEAPALIVRLKTLERVHSAAAGFSQRLDALERSVGGLSAELQSNGQVLDSLQRGLADNSKTILANLKALASVSKTPK